MGHASVLTDLLKDHREVETPSDQIEVEFSFNEKFKAIKSDECRYGRKEMLKCSRTGVYSEELKLEISIPLERYATVFQSETLAISEGCWEMLKRGVLGKAILICVDSESVKRAVSSCKLSTKSVLECRDGLENSRK